MPIRTVELPFWTRFLLSVYWFSVWSSLQHWIEPVLDENGFDVEKWELVNDLNIVHSLLKHEIQQQTRDTLSCNSNTWHSTYLIQASGAFFLSFSTSCASTESRRNQWNDKEGEQKSLARRPWSIWDKSKVSLLCSSWVNIKEDKLNQCARRMKLLKEDGVEETVIERPLQRSNLVKVLRKANLIQL